MSFIKIKIDDSTDTEEFIKASNFVSPFITNIELDSSNSEIIVELNTQENQIDCEAIKNQLEKNLKRFTKSNVEEEFFCSNKKENQNYFDPYEKSNHLFFFANSQVGFGEKGIFLFNYFDSVFEKFATESGSIKKIYPALLSVPEYFKTGYIKKSPQYAIFCSPVKDTMNDVENLNTAISENNGKEKLKEPEFALSPSACFHTYIEYQNQKLENETIITFKQNVFRNEGRLNYKEVGRLMDYHVREIVFIGSSEFVEKKRLEMMNKAAAFLKELNLTGDISLASDSFVLPKMQMYKKIQKIDKTKYEMHLNISEEKQISVASFNLHGKAFTDPFNISVTNTDTVTGCVGFGLQRWVISFVSQYGWDEKAWPENVRSSYKNQTAF